MPRPLTRPDAQDRPDAARAVAHEILVRVMTTDAFADVLLERRVESAGLSAADRGLAFELVLGTLAWQGRLDHHLAGLVRRPLADVEPPVLAALRLGLFQLLFLDRVPAYAAVDASVRLVRRLGRGAAGLVNAVLRRASRLGRTGLVLPACDDPLERLALEWSHPRWLVARWATEFGTEALPRLLAANNTRGPTAIRVNRRRTDPETLRAEIEAGGVAVRRGAFAPSALVVERGGGRLRALPAFAAGHFAFQGEASQLVASMLDVAPGARVLDACAGAGGKALAVAERVGDAGCVVAADLHPGGLRRAIDEAARLGVAIRPVVADARHPPAAATFDAALVDAPCSGLGTLRRHPELRWRRRPDDVVRLAALQRDLLAGVAATVRPGGLLVYAVCTRTHDETLGVVQDFLARTRRFVVEPCAGPCVDADGFLRTAPHTHDLDGFFAARLRARPA
jgi:16S rRNA (cytosine967-C5)-methyltransferase